jgi:threonine dehydrogenase-like Zn-dependent dehydrogenase
MASSYGEAAQKFDPARAGEYEQQSRIALAGYEACHELAACMLAAALGKGRAAHILVAGAGGTAQEIVTAARLESAWRFTAVDPSKPMLDLAVARLAQHGLVDRTEVRLGYVEDLLVTYERLIEVVAHERHPSRRARGTAAKPRLRRRVVVHAAPGLSPEPAVSFGNDARRGRLRMCLRAGKI